MTSNCSCHIYIQKWNTLDTCLSHAFMYNLPPLHKLQKPFEWFLTFASVSIISIPPPHTHTTAALLCWCVFLFVLPFPPSLCSFPLVLLKGGCGTRVTHLQLIPNLSSYFNPLGPSLVCQMVASSASSDLCWHPVVALGITCLSGSMFESTSSCLKTVIKM